MSKKTKQYISTSIDSLINIISSPTTPIEETSFYYKKEERNSFYISLYILKLLITKDEYLLKNYSDGTQESEDKIKKLLELKNKIITNNYEYTIKNQYITIGKEEFDSNELITYMSILLLEKEESIKEIKICYCIPDKDIEKANNEEELNDFLKRFEYYEIIISHTDNTKLIKENNILILRNAAINYLKHLKQYKHGMETKESYLIFYNLLKNECFKQGFSLKENINELLTIDKENLNKILNNIDKKFYEYTLNKQLQIICNTIWQSSNNQNILEQTNNYINSTIKFLNLLHGLLPKKTYKELKEYNTLKDIQILLILIINKFINTYIYDIEDIDYSLLGFTKINPKYMSIIYQEAVEEIKSTIKSYDSELTKNKNNLKEYKEERKNLNKEELGQDKYNKEIERCVSNINRISINIGTINSKLSSLSKEYEEIKNNLEKKYHNLDLYNYNYSIIKHMCNSIIGCSYYLKTNNDVNLFDNVIIFEDYEKTDNSFYLEITFKDLLKISNMNMIKGIIAQNDLPKLVEENKS